MTDLANQMKPVLSGMEWPAMGFGRTPPANGRLFVDTVNETRSALKIRHGGQLGEGFTHPSTAQAAVYVTGLHTNPPANAGGLDLANFYLRYSGTLANMTGSLENVEIVTDLSSVTAPPTFTALGAEVNISVHDNTSGITFPDIRAIYATIHQTSTGAGTLTWARCFAAAIPSASATGGNAITNAACFWAGGAPALGGGVQPTNAYGVYAEVPTIGTNKWAIYANGLVETADKVFAVQPKARVYNSANIATTNGGITALTFDSERGDSDSIHSTAANTNRLTCNTAGWYHIFGHIQWANSTVGNRLLQIRLNGVTAIASERWPAAGGTDLTPQSINTFYQLSTGDYVELIAVQNSGGDLNVNAAGNTSPEFGMAFHSK